MKSLHDYQGEARAARKHAKRAYRSAFPRLHRELRGTPAYELELSTFNKNYREKRQDLLNAQVRWIFKPYVPLLESELVRDVPLLAHAAPDLAFHVPVRSLNQ